MDISTWSARPEPERRARKRVYNRLWLNQAFEMTKPPKQEQQPSDTKPRGPEKVRAALFAAADSLFGEKGPDAVSLREIAARANVNQGLLHRYVGSKEQLLNAIIEQHAEEFADQLREDRSPSEAAARMFDVMIERPAFTRIFAHLLLAGHPAAEFAKQDGGSARLAQVIGQKDSDAPVDPKLQAAICSVLMMGWTLFEPFALYAVDYGGSVDEARKVVRATVADLLASTFRED